jgi:hypothetical protein
MIRHSIRILFILFTLTNISYSQLFNVGFSGELSSSTFGGVSPDNSNYESLLGYGGSLIGEVRITKNVYLSIQPGYLSKGSKIKFGNENNVFNDTTVTFSIKQSYFSLPLSLKIFNRRFYVSAGASVQFLSSAKITTDVNSDDQDVKDKFKSYDIVSNFNVGYQVPVGKPYLFFEFGYIQGLTNINNTNAIGNKDIYIANFKSKGFSFITGLIYPLK